MRYIRNSGRKPVKVKTKNKVREKSTHLKKEKVETKELTEKQQLDLLQKREVATRLSDDLEWLNNLNSVNQFSSEWVHKVAVELLFQCMGKKEVLMGFKGQEQLVRVFKEKPALEALAMIAKMNGHLFDTVKGTIKTTGEIDHNHVHEHKLLPDRNRTEAVFNILEDCGAFSPNTKRLTKDDVEVISA